MAQEDGITLGCWGGIDGGGGVMHTMLSRVQREETNVQGDLARLPGRAQGLQVLHNNYTGDNGVANGEVKFSR